MGDWTSVRYLALALATIVLPTAAAAQERDPCSEFAWPLAQERELMRVALPTQNGATLLSGSAARLAPKPIAVARLPSRPERGGDRPETRAAFVLIEGAPARIQVTLSDEAWIDVVQNGQHLRSLGSTGRRGCDGLRKSVRFEVGGGPFVVQVSGPNLQNIGVIVTPAR